MSRNQLTFAKLIRRVHVDRGSLQIFEGKFVKSGARIDYSTLEDYPAIPVLLETAGKEGPGRNRRDVHILWRYDFTTASWIEILRTLSYGADWVCTMQFAAMKELGGPPPADPIVAEKAARSLVTGLDGEFRNLSAVERRTALFVIYEQIIARIVDLETGNGPILGL